MCDLTIFEALFTWVADTEWCGKDQHFNTNVFLGGLCMSSVSKDIIDKGNPTEYQSIL